MRRLYRSSASQDDVQAWCASRLDEWPVPHTLVDVPTILGQTHVVAAGEGDRVCLFVPGTSFNTATSTALLGALAERMRVYSADLPGQPGLSAAERPSDEQLGYSQWVTDLLRWVREHETGSRVLVAGHSRGAAVALSAPPDLVDGVVALSPAGIIQVRLSRAMLAASTPWLLRPNDDASRRLLEFMSGADHLASEDLVGWMTLVARSCRTTGAPGPLPDTTLDAWEGGNVTVVSGEDDRFLPLGRLAAASRQRLGVLPGLVPGAGHLLTEEEPKLVADVVERAFFS
jgi:pimeloyl-ACP methyl ester carboxylesterase